MKTNNEFFDRNGFLVLKNVCDPKKLASDVPNIRGQVTYFGSLEKYSVAPVEQQVNGSLSRYSFPPYKSIHSEVRKKVEFSLGKELYNTYYYDRFYFPGQELKKHTDRDACEISISIHIGTNLKNPWAFELFNLSGEHKKIFLEPGDGIIYKGCDVVHWREKMPGDKKSIIKKFLKQDLLYYHQIFFHYVLSDGYRSHHAFDMA